MEFLFECSTGYLTSERIGHQSCFNSLAPLMSFCVLPITILRDKSPLPLDHTRIYTERSSLNFFRQVQDQGLSAIQKGYLYIRPYISVKEWSGRQPTEYHTRNENLENLYNKEVKWSMALSQITMCLLQKRRNLGQSYSSVALVSYWLCTLAQF